MNNIRVLRVSNLLLLLQGYQLHTFDAKSQSYRLSLGWAFNVVSLVCFYLSCFVEHFQPAPVLKALHDGSPFLYALTQMQLLLGLKAYSYALYVSVRAVGVAGALAETLPERSGPRCAWFNKDELVAYFLLFSTKLMLFCFALYIGYEMNFELPPMQDAMIGMALVMPHYVLAGGLRFYCILSWITRNRLRQLNVQLDELLSASQTKTELELVAGTTLSIVPATPTAADNLESIHEQLQQLSMRFSACFACLQRSLLLLVGLNGNGLLFGIYAYVYYHSTWHVLFTERNKRIFYASNVCIYACIACDYFCLLLTQSCLEQQRLHFLDKLNTAIGQRATLSKRLRVILKDIRCTLWQTFRFKFLSIWRFDRANFLLLVQLQLLAIALIVMYQQLNDAIVQINDTLASSDDDE
ncbi:hypothetical protein KR222_003689 [Zaprionus bogoriensis]|nr:hypothetical protein KR222_003689 [Zaprionus bogoriensis]